MQVALQPTSPARFAQMGMPTAYSGQTEKPRAMAKRGLKSAAELGKDRPHGVRMRYMSGCRCVLCKKANSTYANERAAAIKAGEGNGIVPADKAQAHMLALSKKGIGRRTVGDITGVSDTILFAVIKGTRTNIRAKTERLILAVTDDCHADRALISSKPSWKLINELLQDGYTKSALALAMGYKTRALQLNRKQCTVRNAATVQQVYDKLRKCAAKPSLLLLEEMREEGYRQDAIDAAVGRAAASLHIEIPSLEVRNHRIRVDAARLIELAHQELTA